MISRMRIELLIAFFFYSSGARGYGESNRGTFMYPSTRKWEGGQERTDYIGRAGIRTAVSVGTPFAARLNALRNSTGTLPITYMISKCIFHDKKSYNQAKKVQEKASTRGQE